MPSVFEKRAQEPQGSAFERRAKETGATESFLKSSARTAYQIPSGIAQTKTYPLDLLQLAGLGHAIDPEEIEHLRKIYEREGIPFDEEKYLQGVQQASDTFPTQGNIERMIEEETEAPLTAKNKLQKAVKLGSGAAKLTPGSLLQKGAAGVGAPLASEGLQALGVPEAVSEIGGLVGGGIGASQIPGKITAGVVKKPSGLTSRRFEDINKKTEVSSKKIGKINEKIENEFRGLAENIIEKSPIKETHAALKNDAAFKSETNEAFKEVSKLSEQLPEKFSTQEVSKELIDQAFKKSKKGFSDSEFDVAHSKFVKDFSKKFNKKEINAKDLIEQYRKNNEALGEVYEPGQSFAYNRAKRQALTDFNKAIAETIEKKFPDSELSNLFKETNKKWSQIMDAESIDKFFDKMFDGKIQFKKGREFFDKQGMTVPFERALGKEGFKDFSQLMNDLLSYEQASKLMKSAESKGFTDLVKTGKAYLLHPKLGLAKTAIGLTKDAYKKVYESLLDKPKISIKWDKGVKAFKKGDFKEAEKIFKDLNQEIQTIPKKDRNDVIKIFEKYNVNETVKTLHDLGDIKSVDDIEKAFLKYNMADLKKIEEETGMSFKDAIKKIINDQGQQSQGPKS